MQGGAPRVVARVGGRARANQSGDRGSRAPRPPRQAATRHRQVEGGGAFHAHGRVGAGVEEEADGVEVAWVCVWGGKKMSLKKGVWPPSRDITPSHAHSPTHYSPCSNAHVERGAAVGVAVVEVDASPSRRAGGVELGVGAPAPRGGGGGQQSGQ